jgi:hypothetical protein
LPNIKSTNYEILDDKCYISYHSSVYIIYSYRYNGKILHNFIYVKTIKLLDICISHIMKTFGYDTFLNILLAEINGTQDSEDTINNDYTKELHWFYSNILLLYLIF